MDRDPRRRRNHRGRPQDQTNPQYHSRRHQMPPPEQQIRNPQSHRRLHQRKQSRRRTQTPVGRCRKPFERNQWIILWSCHVTRPLFCTLVRFPAPRPRQRESIRLKQPYPFCKPLTSTLHPLPLLHQPLQHKRNVHPHVVKLLHVRERYTHLRYLRLHPAQYPNVFLDHF